MCWVHESSNRSPSKWMVLGMPAKATPQYTNYLRYWLSLGQEFNTGPINCIWGREGGVYFTWPLYLMEWSRTVVPSPGCKVESAVMALKIRSHPRLIRILKLEFVEVGPQKWHILKAVQWFSCAVRGGTYGLEPFSSTGLWVAVSFARRL